MKTISVNLPASISLLALADFARDHGHKLRVQPDGAIAMVPREQPPRRRPRLRLVEHVVCYEAGTCRPTLRRVVQPGEPA